MQKFNTSYITKKVSVCKIKSLERITKNNLNKFEGFPMVLRLVSGPILEKSNRTGPLADRQKVLLTARLRVFLFSRIFNYPGNGDFSKNFWGIFGLSGKFLREIFSNLVSLTFFLIFSISDLIFSIFLCCFDKLSLSFSIFSTN